MSAGVKSAAQSVAENVGAVRVVIAQAEAQAVALEVLEAAGPAAGSSKPHLFSPPAFSQKHFCLVACCLSVLSCLPI